MNKKIAFFGADGKCGTSMISLCFAEYLANKYLKDSRLALVYAQEKLGDEYIKEISQSFKNIRSFLDDRYFNPEELLKTAAYKDNLYVLGGSDIPANNGLFHPDASEFVINKMSEIFDLIISDCGCRIENGLSLGALLCADKRIFVFSGGEQCLKRYEWMRPLFEKLSVLPDYYLLNKYSKDSPYSSDYFADVLGIPVEKLITVSFSKYGNEAEMQCKSLLEFRNKAFIKDLDKLAELILKNE